MPKQLSDEETKKICSEVAQKIGASSIKDMGKVMGELVKKSDNKIRLLQFTGSKEVANKLAIETKGKIRIEDAGFDWKIIGPDYDPEWSEYVAWQSDQDAS